MPVARGNRDNAASGAKARDLDRHGAGDRRAGAPRPDGAIEAHGHAVLEAPGDSTDRLRPSYAPRGHRAVKAAVAERAAVEAPREHGAIRLQSDRVPVAGSNGDDSAPRTESANLNRRGSHGRGAVAELPVGVES